MEIVNPLSEVAEAIIEAGGEALKSCYQCGLCTAYAAFSHEDLFMSHRSACWTLRAKKSGFVPPVALVWNDAPAVWRL
jgi:Fe-S oxidoreductase